jgi:hypothetical protein
MPKNETRTPRKPSRTPAGATAKAKARAPRSAPQKTAGAADRPKALTAEQRRDAELLDIVTAIITPGWQRYSVGKEPMKEGYPIYLDGEIVGYMRERDEKMVQGMNTVQALMNSPEHMLRFLDLVDEKTLSPEIRVLLANTRALYRPH